MLLNFTNEKRTTNNIKRQLENKLSITLKKKLRDI